MAAPKTLRFGSMVLLLFALFVPSSFVTAQEPGQIVDAGLDGCSAYVTFIMPYPDEQAPRGASRLAPLNTVYVLVFDEGVLITAYEVTGEAGLTYTVWHPIDRYYGFEGFVFNLNPNSDDDQWMPSTLLRSKYRTRWSPAAWKPLPTVPTHKPVRRCRDAC
ncbi:MAG: hypothetical protein IPK19_38575 [Chloroflexi bacterium]|nr:hypothetical protein [Chloroflexota bacterium]